MKDPIVKETKVVIGPCRLSYTHVFAKYNPSDDNADGKYMTNILIPKTEKKTIKAIQTAIETAKQAGVVGKWGGKEPKKLDMPLRDGDEKDDEVYQGCFFLNAKASTRPGIVDKDRAPIVDEEEIYSGVWAYVSINFYYYDKNGNRGVACGLNNLMKYKDDEHLGGRVSAETDFADIDDEEDDEL